MKIDSKQKEVLLSGVSTMAGAAVGTVGGTFVAQEIKAEVVPEPEKPEPTPEPEPVVDPIVPEPEPVPAPEPVVEPDIQVVNYQTYTNEDGTISDVAVISVDGQSAAVIDVDHDGYADVIAADTNLNGVIDNNEVVNIQGEGVEMQPLRDAYQGNNVYLADNTDPGPDYVNDGNVDDYLA